MLVIFRGLPLQRCYSDDPTLYCLVIKYGWPKGFHEWYTLETVWENKAGRAKVEF